MISLTPCKSVEFLYTGNKALVQGQKGEEKLGRTYQKRTGFDVQKQSNSCSLKRIISDKFSMENRF